MYQENLKREEELKKTRETTEQELQVKIAQHHEEIGRLRAAAEVAAQKTQEEILAKAKEEGKRILAEAKAKKERMRANLVAEMEEKALDLASDIIEHILTAQVAQGINHQLIDELIEEIEKSDGRRVQLDVRRSRSPFPFRSPRSRRRGSKRASLRKWVGRSPSRKLSIRRSWQGW